MIKLNEMKLLELINSGNLEELKLLVETELYNTTISTTDKQRLNAFKKLAKSLLQKKSPVYNRPSMQGAYVDNDNMMTICDSYRVVRLFTDKVIGCTMVDKELKFMDTSKIMKDTKDGARVQIQLDINDILLQYKKFKATKEKVTNVKNYGVYIVELDTTDFDLTVSEPKLLKNGKLPMAFNIQYLKDAHDTLDFSEEIEFYVSDGNAHINPLYIESDNGQGLVLPIRMLVKRDEDRKVVSDWYNDYEELTESM